MLAPPHILLIGPRASGKSSVGAALARGFGCSFADLDELTLDRFAESEVTAVWAAHGEAKWREAEILALEPALAAGGVLALGGGTPMIAEARRLILREQARKNWGVAYLEVPVAVLQARLTAHSGDRPSLTGADVAAEAEDLLALREPTYRSLADWIIPGEAVPEVVASLIVAQLDSA